MIIYRTGLSLFVLLMLVSTGFSQTTDDKIRNATKRSNSKQKFKLEYKLKAGQEVRWNVEHVASTKAQIAGQKEESSSRSTSRKLWQIRSVDSKGNMTFVHSIEAVNMWQQLGEAEPVTYDSETGEKAPVEFETVTEKIGKPLAVFTVSPQGRVVDRKTSLAQARFGVGEVTVPLPPDSIAIGHKWYVPSQLTAKDEDGRTLQLKTRLHYELSKVKFPNAYISFRTEVLTPIKSDKVKSQIMQQLTKGYIIFNIKDGLPIHKEIQWDEKVQGYEGDDSYLNYVGKMTERLIVSQGQRLKPSVPDSQKSSDAQKNNSNTTVSTARLKTRNGKPIMRK